MKYKINNKKGSHVGVVLSFIIFITFLLFVILIIQSPVREEQDKSRYLDTLRLNLFQNFTASGGDIMVIYNSTPITSQQQCVRLFGILGNGENQIPFEFINENRLRIVNLTNQPFNYSQQGGDSFRTGQWAPGYLRANGYYLKVYFLEQPIANPGQSSANCVGADVDDFEIAFITEEGSVFPGEEQINNLTDAVSTEELYDAIKLALDIPPGSDFAFNFTFSDGTIIGTGWDVPSGTGLFIREYSVLYLDSDEELQLGKLILGIW